MITKNIPNYLTTFRIILIPIIVMSFYLDDDLKYGQRIGAITFLFASITDFLDGFLARKYNLVSNFGIMFDQISDKVLIGSVLLMLVKFHKVDEVPCILIITREFVVAGCREFLSKIGVATPVMRLAKIKTCTQMIAITILLFASVTEDSSIKLLLGLIGNICLWCATILTLITGYSYFKISIKHIS